MASTATVTGKVGPDITATAVVISNVASFEFVSGKEMLYIKTTDGQYREFSIAAAVTITLTVSGDSYTLTVANS